MRAGAHPPADAHGLAPLQLHRRRCHGSPPVVHDVGGRPDARDPELAQITVLGAVDPDQDELLARARTGGSAPRYVVRKPLRRRAVTGVGEVRDPAELLLSPSAALSSETSLRAQVVRHLRAGRVIEVDPDPRHPRIPAEKLAGHRAAPTARAGPAGSKSCDIHPTLEDALRKCSEDACGESTPVDDPVEHAVVRPR